MEILNLKLKDQDLEAADAAKKVAIDVLCRARNRPNFGNAGEVENLLAQAKARYQTRQASLPTEEKTFDIVFQPQDFDLNFDRDARASVNLSKLFDGVVGCEDIITKLRGYQETARKMKARGMDAKDQIPTNFVMKGPPGTFPPIVSKGVPFKLKYVSSPYRLTRYGKDYHCTQDGTSLL